MTISRARPCLPASLNMRRVLTSMPLAAETTIDGGLDGGQRFQGGADEVGVAGGVEEVDVLALVLEVEDAGVDGEVVLLLLVVVVGDAGAVVHAAHAVDGVGLEEQGIGQRGLAAARCPTRAMLRMSLS